MNRTDAAAILSIDPSASPEEARRAYQDLFTEHQVRLTNAPTPALRSLYQARLLELDEARDAFLANDLSDADSDLPTDQPSIPNYGTGGQQQRGGTPPPPPPPRTPPEQEAPPRGEPSSAKKKPEPDKRGPATEPPAAPAKKPASKKTAGVVLGVIVIALSLLELAHVMGETSSDTTTADSVASAPKSSYLADSLPKLREGVTVARVEFGRGDYDAANSALKDAYASYSLIPDATRSDTGVVRIKSQLDSIQEKVRRACDALKKVAERHPGERTCKPL